MCPPRLARHSERAWHCIGEFTVGGWSFEALKRNFGMNYMQEVRAGRRASDYKSFVARDGNPFSLLEDDRREAICEILEGSRH